MAILVFTTVISTFLGQALNGKRCKAAAPKLDRCQARAGAVWQRTPPGPARPLQHRGGAPSPVDLPCRIRPYAQSL